eukprot:jgi/Psemu1/299294/fgenesh1_pm.1155_\
MNSRKEKLERSLRLSVEQAEEDLASPTSSSDYTRVLEAIHIFLTQWDALEGDGVYIETVENGNGQSRTLPVDYLHLVFCRVLSNLNPLESTNLVRKQLLSTLRYVETVDCRQVLLDFLPAVTKMFCRNENDDGMWNEGHSKKMKKDILSCLREVFENDSDSLSQILFFFSSFLDEDDSQKKIMGRSDFFLFVVGILPRVPETNLHTAVQALIRYVDSAEDARLAVDSVRAELALLEKTDISDMASVATVFNETIRSGKKNEELFVEEYLVVIEELIDERQRKQFQSQTYDKRQVEMQLLTFDLVMTLLPKQNPLYRDRIFGMISNGSLVESGLLSALQLSKLIELVDGNCERIAEATGPFHPSISNLRHCLLGSLVDISMLILLIPLRCTTEVNVEKFFSQVQVILVQIMSSLPDDFQPKAISVALAIFEKLMAKNRDEGVTNSDKDRLKSNGENYSKVRLSIFSLLLSLSDVKHDHFMPFRNRLLDHIMSGSFDYTQDLDLLKTLCKFVAKLGCVKKADNELDLVMICRSLLFSTPENDPTTSSPHFDEYLTQRRIRGMMFARAVVSCCDIDLTRLAAVQKMVSRILISPHSDILYLDPRVGFHGMQIVRRLHEQMTSDSSARNELFQVISLVLTHSRVVHYPEGSSTQTAKKPNTVLAYTEIPSFFSIKERMKQRRKFRKMTFCFDFFFTDETTFVRSTIWERSTSWIFELIDTYLSLGRTAKWNPRAWIFAGIIFPAVSSSTMPKTREKSLLHRMESDFSRFGCSQQSPLSTSTIDKQIADIMKKARTLPEKEAIVDSTCRFALTLLFALSSSAAILRNTYDHYKDTLKANCNETEFEGKSDFLQMMQYQLIKMYDLNRRCQSMERLFGNIGSRNHSYVSKKTKKTKRKKSNKTCSSSEKTEMQIKAELAGQYLREANVRFFHSTRIISSRVLWISLTDSSNDSLIISAVNNSQQGQTFESIFDVVQMRLNLIEHLVTCIAFTPFTGCQKNHEVFHEKNQLLLQRYVIRCLRLASFLLLKLPLIKEAKATHTSTEILIKLISAYLRLVRTILISRTGIQHPKQLKRSDDDIGHYFSLYVSVIGSKQPLTSTVEYMVDTGQLTTKDLKALVCSFRVHVRDYHDSITSQLLETLSIFAARSESSILTSVIDFHWNATFMCNYSNAVDHMSSLGPPFALTKLLKSLSPSSQYGFSIACAEDRYKHKTVMKLMNCRFNKFGERNLFLIHSICRHWSLLALSPRKISLFTSFLETLLEKLVEYLKDVDDFSKEKDSKEGEELSDDEDGEYRPPSSTSVFRVCKASIPSPGEFKCLTPTSYPIFFDIVLRTTVSSISLFSLPEAMSNFEKPLAASCRHHPVDKLQSMIAVYGSLIQLYKDKFHVFPKLIFSSVVHASKCMLDISASKVQEYIEWRNYQPVHPFQDSAEFFDPASTSFLKNLLDTFGIHVVGSLRLFCSMRSEATKSLLRKVERIFDFLSQTSNRYDTGEIRTDNLVRGSLQGNREEIAEFLQSEHSTTAEESSVKGVNVELKEAYGKMPDSSLIRKRKSFRDAQQLSYKGFDVHELEDEESFTDAFVYS